MLKDEFFKITGSAKNESGVVTYSVTLNPNHPIFSGHFPGNPISPGVCNIGMIKACAEHELGYGLLLGNIKQCKFKHLITPTEHPDLDIVLDMEEMENGNVKLNAKITKGDIVFMEMKGEASSEL